jgi:hypothetical protein
MQARSGMTTPLRPTLAVRSEFNRNDGILSAGTYRAKW